MGLRSTRIGFCLSVAGTADVQRRAMMQQLASVQWLTSSPLAQMARPRCSARCTWVSLWLFRVPCRTTPNCKALTRSWGRADRFTAYSRKKTLADSLQNGKHRNDGSKWATNHVLCPVCCATLTGAAYPRSRGGTFFEKANGMAQQFRAGVMSHVDGEYKTYRSSVYQGAQAAEVQNIAANFHDADAVRTSIDNLKYHGFTGQKYQRSPCFLLTRSCQQRESINLEVLARLVQHIQFDPRDGFAIQLLRRATVDAGVACDIDELELVFPWRASPAGWISWPAEWHLLTTGEVA